ncbi:MAG: adenylate/guanylate cyclase domain-containing protein [Bacteroidales bacterium]
MAFQTSKTVPRFFGLRIYLFSTILYYWLVLPFLLILTIKYAPELRELSKQAGAKTESDPANLFSDSIYLKKETNITTLKLTKSDDSLSSSDIHSNQKKPETTGIRIDPLGVKISPDPASQTNGFDSGKQVGRAFNLLFNMLLISFFLGLIFNIPFKRYFSRKRRRRTVSPKLFSFCKRYILRSPVINAGILGLAYAVAHVFMLVTIWVDKPFSNDLEQSIYVHFFFISITASILSLLFVYYWEKHRVHLRYLEHIFLPEELRKRIFNLKVGRIRNRMFLSFAMTTLLPLTIVILYLFLSVTYLRDFSLEDFSEEHKKILLGDYAMFGSVITSSGQDLNIPGWLFYINAINSFFMFIGIYSSIFIAFVYILFLVKWTTQDIVYPVKELLENMRKTGKGELHHYSLVRTNDEIGELTEGYNEMTQKIGDFFNNITRMNEAYSYFVPRQFLEFLGKESFVDIRLGDQVEKEMTVLFSDIRSFTEISETMTPKENFDFINYYLGYMEPVIRNNNGFIDKYIGDSIMALFSESAEDSINAAIEMRIKLSQFNQVMDQFGRPTINSGIGIHTGMLMLGVVGGEGRMDGTVISDAVNLAARLEGLTKLYGGSIIISQDTLIKLKNPAQYHYRFLDIVKVKGKREAVYIFEILDGDPEDIRQLKIQTREQFAGGINYYKSGSFEKASEQFKAIMNINPHDKAASVYYSRCKKFAERGVPDDWDGIQTISWD